ncbi:MAG: hypothetical protein KBS82_07800 [Oscillospiraceae bacterium]|nr:hypothetical protein [Candidatus Limimonas egerieequi]
MRKVIPKNIADEMAKPYIDEAVEKQIKAADVPPRNKLDISFKDAGRTDDNKDYDSNQDAYEKNHGKLYDMTHNNTIPWKNYVVYLVLLSLLTTVFTFSKYLSGASGSSNVAVAKFDPQIVCVGAGTDVTGVTISSDGLTSTALFASPQDISSKEIIYKITNNSEVVVSANVTLSGTLSGATWSANPTTIDTIAIGESRDFSITIKPNVTNNLILDEITSQNLKVVVTVNQKD